MSFINIDIEIDEIISNMGSYDKQEMVDELYECGYTPKQLKSIEERFEANTEFDKQVVKLIGNSWKLSKEDEETILRITNKLN